ncbi:MAG TPA: ABC transporter permease [Terracidiphilus sp.]|jgi:predicted permease|nr:ABC transporter permease [Terracidiphilus sp.]
MATFGASYRLPQDVLYAARQFRRAPGYAIFAGLVLALGIGTVTAMFTISYAVLLKPLPFAADRMLFQPVLKTPQGLDDISVPYAEIKEWQRATAGSADVAFNGGGLNIADGPAGAVLMQECTTSTNLLSVLGVHPVIGRAFLPQEEETDSPNVVLLSDALWRQEFAGDPNVLGKTLHIGPAAYSVVGVMPPQFRYPLYVDGPQAFVPIGRALPAQGNRDFYTYLGPLVRVHPGVPVNAVTTLLARVHKQFAPAEESQLRLAGLRALALLVSDVRPALLALQFAVALVWLIACANVAGLMLARIAARRNEIAVRAALGAGRKRIVSQFLAESLALSCAGAVGGLALAAALLRIFRHMLGRILPLDAAGIHLSWPVFSALLVLTFVTAIAFGVFPALIAARADVAGALSGGRTHSGDRGQNRARATLLVSQVALSIMLLIGAGLMLRTLYALRHVPLGFRTDHLVLTTLTVPNDLYNDRNLGTAVWQPLLDQIQTTPGVRSAALSTVLPISHPVELITLIYNTERTHKNESATVRAATPGLMDVLGIRVLTGRFFNQQDTASSLPVTVVNQTYVNRYFGGENPIGRQIRYGRVPRAATIVGVIEDIHQESPDQPSQAEFYLSMSQIDPSNAVYRALLGRYMEVAVRTETAPGALIPQLQQTIHQANPHLAVGEFSTMAEAVEDSISAQKLAAGVIGAFSALVLLITMAGLYGLLSFLVARRSREIGIRMALGADRGRVVAMVMRQTLLLLGAGTFAGIGLALAAGRLLQRFLFGVRATDPWTIILASLALLACGILASLVPARRAASVNPLDALRTE